MKGIRVFLHAYFVGGLVILRGWAEIEGGGLIKGRVNIFYDVIIPSMYIYNFIEQQNKHNIFFDD